MGTQTRHIEVGVDVTSYQHNQKHQGLFPPGRYRGLDSIEFSGSSIELSGGTTAFPLVSNEGEVTGSQSVVVTPQGVIIQFDGTFDIALSSNVGNPLRYDALIFRHAYNNALPGGSDGEFIVENDIDPDTFSVSEQATDIIIGIFIIAANSTIGSGSTTFIPSRVPSIGNEEYARINEVNRFLKQQQWNQGTGFAVASQTVDGVSKKIGTFNNDGNFYRLETASDTLELLPMLPVGTLIALNFKNAYTLRDALYLGLGDDLPDDGGGVDFADFTESPVGYADGYAGIETSTLLNTNYTLVPDSIILLQMVDKGGSYGKRWKLIASSSLITQVGTLTSTVNSLSTTVASHTSTLATQGALINSLISSYEAIASSLSTLNTAVNLRALKSVPPARVIGSTSYPFANPDDWGVTTLTDPQSLSYRKNDMGMVILSGAFKQLVGSPASNIIHVLEPGFRPVELQRVLLIRSGSSSANPAGDYGTGVEWLMVKPTGEIEIASPFTDIDTWILCAPLVFYAV